MEAQDRRRHAATYASRSGVPIEIVSQAPFPIANFWHVFAVFVNIVLMVEQLVADRLFGIGSTRPQTRHTIDHIADQVKEVEFVQHHHVKGGGGRSLFFVPADVQLLVIGPTIGQAMDQPGIAVEGEDDGFVLGPIVIQAPSGSMIFGVPSALKGP